jgi:hypothetical protein
MKSFPTCIFCVVCYMMAAMWICIELLPPEAFAIFGGKVAGDTLGISLAVAGVFLALGVILHVVFYRWSPQRFDVRAFWTTSIGMIAVLAGLFGLSIVLARCTGLPPAVLNRRFEAVMAVIGWVGLTFVGAVVILCAVFFACLFVWLRLHRANRMARRLAAGDFAGAIRIGEARPQQNRDFTANVNLVMAYALSGQREKAQKLMALMEQTDEVPKYYTQETLDQTLDHLRKVVHEGLEARASRSDDAHPSRATSPEGNAEGAAEE